MLALLALLGRCMDKDAKYDHNVSSAGCVFFPLVVETLGLWTDSSISLLRRIAARTTLSSGVSQGQAFHNLLQQLSVKLWSYNAKRLLHHISLLPVTESDPLDQSLFSLENSSHYNDVNFNGILCGTVGGGSPVYSQVFESSSSSNMSHSFVSPEVSLAVKLTLFLSRVTLPMVYKVKPPIKRLPNSFQYNHSSHLHRSHILLMPLLLLHPWTSTLPCAVEGYSRLHLLCISPKSWRKQRPARNFILLITTHKHLHHSIRLLGRRILLPGKTERPLDSLVKKVLYVNTSSKFSIRTHVEVNHLDKNKFKRCAQWQGYT